MWHILTTKTINLQFSGNRCPAAVAETQTSVAPERQRPRQPWCFPQWLPLAAPSAPADAQGGNLARPAPTEDCAVPFPTGASHSESISFHAVAEEFPVRGTGTGTRTWEGTIETAGESGTIAGGSCTVIGQPFYI